MDDIEISIDDDLSLLEDLLKSPIPDFLDDNQLFGDAFFQNSEICSSYSNAAPSQTYCPSLDATKEYQQTNVGDLKGSLGEITPNLIIDEPRQHEQIPAMTTSTNVIIGNDDQQNNEYSKYTMEDLFKFAEALSPHPQQNVIKPIYNENEQFLPPMPPTILTSYPNMNTCMGGLYQGEMGLSACNGGQGQHLFSYGILPLRMPASNLMPTTMSRPMSVLKTNYQNNNVRPYNLHDTFLPCGYKTTNLQVLKNRLQQQHPHNNSSSLTFSGTVPDISTPQTSTLKGGCISAEEKSEKIERYKSKRKRRDFSKKIKYACRKILADSRPRVRGRFAKNDETKQMARTCSTNFDELQQMARASSSNQDCNNVEVAINNGRSLEEPAFDPLDFLILDG